MKENESALYSHYIIDGMRQEMTPAELLDECMEYDETYEPSSEMFGTFNDIIDESTDPPVTAFAYDKGRNAEYVAMTKEASGTQRQFPMLYPDHCGSADIPPMEQGPFPPRRPTPVGAMGLEHSADRKHGIVLRKRFSGKRLHLFARRTHVRLSVHRGRG